MKKNSILIFLLCISFSFSQSNEEFYKKLDNYFTLSRENIHLHLNKDKYFSNETIWFKGYVLDKKTEKLNPLTTNVFIKIYDEDKNEIESLLFNAVNGSLIGQIRLSEKYKSGKYYLHVFTNYMNNFIEDESNLETISIININDTEISETENTSSDLNITYNFEGGKLLFESKTNVVIRITNCMQEGLEIKDVELLKNNNLINKFSTNPTGLGIFSITPETSNNYKIRFTYKNRVHIKEIKDVSFEGINLTANSYASLQHVIVTLKTNKLTLEKFHQKKLTLLIQKGDSLNLINYQINKTENLLAIEKKNFFKGINNIILLDEVLNKISERIIYIPNIEKTKLIKVSKSKDSIKLMLNTTNHKIANFSISVFPSESKYDLTKNSIINSLIFKNNLEEELYNPNYYFENFDRKKQFELDLFLIGQKSKYKIENILNKTINENYEFDFGLTVKGKINQKLNNLDKLKIRILSYNGLTAYGDIESDNSFTIKNLIAVDSSTCHFTLLKNKEKVQSLALASNFTNNKRIFNKPINISKYNCPKNYSHTTNSQNITSLFKKDENIIELDSVELESLKKVKAENKGKYFTNSYATFYKISEVDYTTYNDILSFISFHGFDVNKTPGNIQILSRSIKSLRGSRNVSIFLNNAPLYDLEQLLGMSMREIDEVYINRSGFGEGMDGVNGSIRIYTNTTIKAPDNDGVKSKSFVVKNGFQKVYIFKNSPYQNYDSEVYLNYGVVDWKNDIFTNENGTFEITIPYFELDEVLLNLQGIDSDGNVYHDILTVKTN